MRTKPSNRQRFALAGAVFATTLLLGCEQSQPSVDNNPTPISNSTGSSADKPIVDADGKIRHAHGEEGEHEHIPGAHGGVIVALGRDSYHVEPVFDGDGTITLYMLQADETKVLEIEAATLAAHIKSADMPSSMPLEFQPLPQSDDSAGKTSRFVGTIPEAFRGKTTDIVVPSLRIEGERFRLWFSSPELHSAEAANHSMPTKVADDSERELYLTPGGIYTAADIEANGNQTASQKFAGFKSAHDMNPQTGDKICPVTQTKANSKCSWIVNAKTYEFCCPPCVDEFVKMAKNSPEKILSPEEYIK